MELFVLKLEYFSCYLFSEKHKQRSLWLPFLNIRALIGLHVQLAAATKKWLKQCPVMDPLNKDDCSQPEAVKPAGRAVDSIFKCEQTCTASASYIQRENETTKTTA